MIKPEDLDFVVRNNIAYLSSVQVAMVMRIQHDRFTYIIRKLINKAIDNKVDIEVTGNFIADYYIDKNNKRHAMYLLSEKAVRYIYIWMPTLGRSKHRENLLTLYKEKNQSLSEQKKKEE